MTNDFFVCRSTDCRHRVVENAVAESISHLVDDQLAVCLLACADQSLGNHTERMNEMSVCDETPFQFQGGT